MKNLIVSLVIYLILTVNSLATISSGGDNSDLTKENFSKSQFGLSLALSKEFKIIESIFTEDDQDYLFNEIGIFLNYYDDIINYAYGTNLSFGYGYDKFAIYINSGYLITDFDYLANNVAVNYSEGSGFAGIGTSYKITDNLKTKLDFMNYSFNFNPSNSGAIQKVEVDIRSVTAGLQFYF